MPRRVKCQTARPALAWERSQEHWCLGLSSGRKSTCPVSPAQGFGLNPYGMAVALGTLLLTPLGHPVNVLVMGSAKVPQVGSLLTALLFIVVPVFLPLLWPLR